jgi:hypothetical protein
MTTSLDALTAYYHVETALKELKAARKTVDLVRAGGTKLPPVAYVLGAANGRAAIAQENLEVLQALLLELRFDLEGAGEEAAE